MALPRATTGRRPAMTASWITGRKRRMAILARLGWTRLVSRMTAIDRSTCTQKEVPVNPRWPMAVGGKNRRHSWGRPPRACRTLTPCRFRAPAGQSAAPCGNRTAGRRPPGGRPSAVQTGRGGPPPRCRRAPHARRPRPAHGRVRRGLRPRSTRPRQVHCSVAAKAGRPGAAAEVDEKERVRRAQRRMDFLGHETVQAPAGNGLHDPFQDHEIQVAVKHPLARRAQQRLLHQPCAQHLLRSGIGCAASSR